MALGAIRGNGKDMNKVVHELARRTQLNVPEVEEVIRRVYGDLNELHRDRRAMRDAYVTVGNLPKRFFSREISRESLVFGKKSLTIPLQSHPAAFQCTSDLFANYGCYQYLQHSQQHNRATYGYRFDYTSRNMWGWLAAMIPYLGK